MDSTLEQAQPTALGTLFRRIVAGLVFVTLFVGVMGGAHFYLVTRLALDPGWPRPVVYGSVVLLAAGLGSLIVQGIPRRHRSIWGNRFAFGAYSWMGLLFYLFLATAAADAVELALRGTGLIASAPESALAVARVKATAALGVAVLATGFALQGGRRMPKVKPLEVPISGLAAAFDGFRIVQISDIHIGPLLDREFAGYLTEAVNDLEPDLVAVTGDLVDGSVNRLAHDVEPFADLGAPQGVFFVTGNHDFYSGVGSWTDRVQEFGWRPLRNRAVTIEREGSSFFLAGVDDPHGAIVEGAGGEDLDSALRDTNDHAPTILLAHDPSSFRRARRRGVALQLSGHTHGGQIWPFGFAVRLAVPWVAGHYRDGDAQLYVSCGTGFWGPPMRLGTESEITEIILRAA